ncbi:MAG: hypothetical protein NT141_00080 [candidate division WWE3 bacterium]|nr:hypothetical protein [candidate division WWE3 bacterium]
MINYHPSLKFELNKEMDYWTAKEFVEPIIKRHPDLASLKQTQKELWPEKIKEYVDSYYTDHDQEIKAVLEKTQTKWDEIYKEFYQAVDRLFDRHPWPKGEYLGFASIFDCNPRFLGNKTFQFFYNHQEGTIYVAAHEMLHFMFFDYAFKHFPKLTEDDLWDLSEIFNVIILSRPEFVAITGNSSPRAYRDHLKDIQKYTNLWKNSKDVKGLIKSALDLQ